MNNLEQLVDKLHLEDLRNELHPSFFDVNDGYDMLILRLPLINGILEVKSIGFVLTKEKSYLYDKVKEEFVELDDKFEALHNITDKILDQLLNSFSEYRDNIVDMEELLYENRNISDFMTQWLDLKRDLLRIEKVLMRSSHTMNEVVKFYENEEGFPINSYIDLHEHMERTMRSAELQLSKLDYLYSFYTARTNEKMNKMIYVLTFISAIFLPLNLVVGFFGMNTSSLPFADGVNGTYNALLLMSLLFVLTSGILYLWNRKTKEI
jgi:magnesium transporter